mmetsp:Transcript_8058/g.16667  ORF Transcript_8058/g.16667 Transcript_8058/m.16667 type:complete len:349 (-) Transcript_8058:1751-2797(-)
MRGRNRPETRVLQPRQLRQGPHRPQHDQRGRGPRGHQARRDRPGRAHLGKHRDRSGHGRRLQGIRHDPHHARIDEHGAPRPAESLWRQAGADPRRQGHGGRHRQGRRNRRHPGRLLVAAIQQRRQPEGPPRNDRTGNLGRHRGQGRHPGRRRRNGGNADGLRTVPQAPQPVDADRRRRADRVGRSLRRKAGAPQDPGHRGRLHPRKRRHQPAGRGHPDLRRRRHGDGPQDRHPGGDLLRDFQRGLRAGRHAGRQAPRKQGKAHRGDHPLLRGTLPLDGALPESVGRGLEHEGRVRRGLGPGTRDRDLTRAHQADERERRARPGWCIPRSAFSPATMGTETKQNITKRF